MQIPDLRRLPKSLVVVGPAPAGVLYSRLEVEQVDHLMEHRSCYVFDGPVKGPGSYVQFMPLSSIRPLPRLGYGDMTVSPGGALDGDNSLILSLVHQETFFKVTMGNIP